MKKTHVELSKVIGIGSMYGIYANIWGILMVNVTIYSIHGSYGIGIGLPPILHHPAIVDCYDCWIFHEIPNHPAIFRGTLW